MKNAVYLLIIVAGLFVIVGALLPARPEESRSPALSAACEQLLADSRTSDQRRIGRQTCDAARAQRGR